MPAPLPFPCIDVHVHLHPERLAGAIERHFAARGWTNLHPFTPERAIVDTLRAHGVERFCFFTYAHRPGMARALNRWVAETAASLPGTIPLGTVHVEDPDLPDVVREAVEDLGLAGFKLHHSVQRFSPDDARLFTLYERAQAEGLPLMVHAGTAPYRDPHTGFDAFRRIMGRFPGLRACVAHMGAHDSARFLALTGEFQQLYLDTSMTMSPLAQPWVGAEGEAIATEDILRHQDRILFGSDFPLPPYEYEEERRWAWDRGLPDDVLRKIFHDNAVRFLGL